MSAQEQEARIAQLQSLRNLYKGDGSAAQATDVTQAPTPTAESSDDSDSEEE
jgi:bromodomain-containing factor 1